MAIKVREIDGKKVYDVFVSNTARGNRGMRKQIQRTGIRSLPEAQRIERHLKAKVERELFERANAEPLWKDLTASWEEQSLSNKIRSGKLSRASHDDYVQVIRDHTEKWAKKRVSEISPLDVEILINGILKSGLTKATAKRTKNIIGSVFKWAIRNGQIRGLLQSPVELAELNFKANDELPEILNQDEIRILLTHAHRLRTDWYPIWKTALLTGMRNGELYALKWSAIDLEKSLIYVHRAWDCASDSIGPTKGRYWRTVPINEELKHLLLQFRSNQVSEYVLPRLNDWKKGEQARILRTFCASIGLTPIRFHTLRACFATALLSHGVSIAHVMAIGGWKDIKTMQRYIRLSGLNVKGATDHLSLTPSLEMTLSDAISAAGKLSEDTYLN